MKTTLKFVQEKETKGTVRFKEVGAPDEVVVGTLYVKKAALEEPYPEKLTVTIEDGA